MTEPVPAQTAPNSQPRPPRPKWGTCRICGQWKRIAARGLCAADYATLRRRAAGVPPRQIQPGDPRARTLDALAAAYDRVVQAETDAKKPLATLRGYAVGAYTDGLSYEQVADLAGRSQATVNTWVPPEDTRSTGSGRAPEEVVNRWRPLLAAARDAADAAAERVREVRAQCREQLQAATADDNPARAGLARIAARLGMPLATAQLWSDPERDARSAEAKRIGLPRRQCVGVRPDGARCGSPPRVGRLTCWNHRAQEPRR